MYPLVLALHSWLRWVVLVLLLLALARAVAGRGGRPWTAADNAAGKWLGIAFDIQFTLGLLLYIFLSPITRIAFTDFGGAMANSGLRFFAVEHVVGMFIAMALVHVGKAKIRKADAPARRHTLAMIFFGLALLVMLASIPWPGMPAGRPLFRAF